MMAKTIRDTKAIRVYGKLKPNDLDIVWWVVKPETGEELKAINDDNELIQVLRDIIIENANKE